MGVVLREGLLALAEQHPCVGDVRGVVLHQVIELVANRESRKPMCGFNQPLSDPVRAVESSFRVQGLNPLVRWSWVFSCPPLIITEEQIQDRLAMLDRALEEADRYYEG